MRESQEQTEPILACFASESCLCERERLLGTSWEPCSCAFPADIGCAMLAIPLGARRAFPCSKFIFSTASSQAGQGLKRVDCFVPTDLCSKKPWGFCSIMSLEGEEKKKAMNLKLFVIEAVSSFCQAGSSGRYICDRQAPLLLQQQQRPGMRSVLQEGCVCEQLPTPGQSQPSVHQV